MCLVFVSLYTTFMMVPCWFHLQTVLTFDQPLNDCRHFNTALDDCDFWPRHREKSTQTFIKKQVQKCCFLKRLDITVYQNWYQICDMYTIWMNSYCCHCVMYKTELHPGRLKCVWWLHPGGAGSLAGSPGCSATEPVLTPHLHSAGWCLISKTAGVGTIIIQPATTIRGSFN